MLIEVAMAIELGNGAAREAGQHCSLLHEAVLVKCARRTLEDARGLITLRMHYSRRANQRRIARRQTKRGRLRGRAVTRGPRKDGKLNSLGLLAMLDDIREDASSQQVGHNL